MCSFILVSAREICYLVLQILPSSGLVLTLLLAIQGFNERLVTASRPGIGLMFKQVCKQDGLFPLMNHVLLCNLSFNAFVLFATSVVDCNSLP